MNCLFVFNVVNSIGYRYEINISNSEFLSNVINKHSNRESIMTIKDNHANIITFNFKQLKLDCVYKMLCKLKINNTTGYDNVPPNGTGVC